MLLLLGWVSVLKSAPFAVDDERDMVASRSIRGGTYCFGSGAQRRFTVLLNADSGISDQRELGIMVLLGLTSRHL